MKRSHLLSAMILLFASAIAAVLLLSLAGDRSVLKAGASPNNGTQGENPVVLSAPAGLSAQALENGELRLSWDTSSVAGAALLELSYRRAEETGFTVASLSADLDSCLLVGFGDGEAVELRLRTADAAGAYSDYSGTVSVMTLNTQPPACPAGFSGTARDGAVTLTWDPNSESDLLGYLLEYRKTGDSLWMSVDTGRTDSCSREGLPNGQAYEFRLMARDSAGILSPCSPVITLTPAVGAGHADSTTSSSVSGTGISVRADTPGRAAQSSGSTTASDPSGTGSAASGTLSGLTVTAGRDSDVLAVWQTGGSGITEVELSWQKEGVSGWSSRSAAYSAGKLQLSALSAGSVYHLRTRVRTETGWGSYSTPVALTVTDTTPPAAPEELSASPAEKAMVLGWTPNTEPDLAGYRMEYRAAGVADWLTLTPGKSASEIRVSGLVNGTLYEFRLLAGDAAGNWSAPSRTVSAAPMSSSPPPTPAGLKGQAVSHDSVLLSWSPPAADHGVAGYQLEYTATGGFSVFLSLSAVTSYTVTDLLPETAYSFSLRAKDAAGRLSDVPRTITVTTPKKTVPAPYNLAVSATAAGDGAVISWSYTDGVSLSSFLIEYRLMGTVKGQTTAGPLSRSCTVGGLPPEGGYQFYVTAVDLLGNLSEKTGPVVLALVDETPPQSPSGLTATPSGTGAVLSWSSSPDADVAGYELRYGTSGSYTTLTFGSGVTYASLSGLTAGATYDFSVRAFDRAGNYSPYGSSASCAIENTTPPDSPMGLTADGGEGTLYISWRPNSERNIEGYEVSWSGPAGGSTFTSDTSLSLTSLPPGSYTVSVRARTTAGVYSSSSSAAAVVSGGESGGEIDSGGGEG